MSANFASVVVGVAGFMGSMAGTLCAAEQAKPADYYTEEHIYQTRPDPKGERFFGVIGTTGIKARVYPGVVLKVEEMMPGSPSEGKFAKDEILTGINGISLKGLDPFVAMGNALTKAEATDGKMVFDVTSADGKTQRKETVTIPVLGAYSKTWPLDCPKSKRIIDEAAAFYADPQKFNARDIPGALGCLFLLSTGDDKYLPRVKAYFDAFPKDVKDIGVSTWSNGYNGIACGEYYLRTGDKSVLPIMQYYCDDAKEHQSYGCGWSHYGAKSIWPGYVAGGIVHAAGLQVLTTLLLGKECGVNVDDKTLLGALLHVYRFAGHGSVPYGDHRGEGGLGSNGKDGMVAAAMQIAAGASGDVTIYEKARNCLALEMIDSYSSMVMGHGDNGRSDAIWRSITTSYLMKDKPELFRESMDRLTWWHDLSREPGGSIGIATLNFMNDSPVGHSGPGMGLSYTAPLRTLRITGAPKTEYSQKFTLPENLWGTEADLAFLSLEHNPQYLEYGPEEPAHVPYWALGGAYHQPKNDIKTLPREVILKNVYHRQFMIRTQAGKALRAIDAFDDLEKLLEDPDPRVRRAALDGMTDYNYWFGIGDNPIPTDKFTPAMLKSITKMLSDPNEAWWVVHGALMALKFAPAKDIQQNYKLIEPWTKHPDWWFRDSAFQALSGLEKDDALYVKILPTLLKMATSEYHTMPREWMMQHLNAALQQKKPESDAGKLILAGLRKGVDTGEIKNGDLGVGAYNIIETLKLCLQNDPTLAPALATALQLRFSDLRTGDIVGIVADPGGFTAVLEKLDFKQSEELKDILFKVYRPEIIKRLKAKDYADEGHKPGMVSAIVNLTKLKGKVAVPGPDPATFASPPSISGTLDIVMKATPGRDDFEPIEYFFDETSGNPGGADSGWTTHPVYTDPSLEPGTSYTYTVKMRNALGQEGNASLPVSVTTPAAEFVAVPIPNGGFDTIYKPGQTTITATISGYTNGVGPATAIRGNYNYSDKTSGSLADVPDWIGYDRDGWIEYGGTGPWGTQNWNLQGFLSAGGKKEGGNSFSCNGGDWSCREGGLIVSAAPIGKVQTNATYVLVGYAAGSATPIVLKLLADGVAVTPTSAIDPQLTGGWQKFSRTYAPADLAKHFGKEITIVCGLGRDAKGEQTAIDDLSLRYFIVP
jgi:hypothetical protein